MDEVAWRALVVSGWGMGEVKGRRVKSDGSKWLWYGGSSKGKRAAVVMVDVAGSTCYTNHHSRSSRLPSCP